MPGSRLNVSCVHLPRAFRKSSIKKAQRSRCRSEMLRDRLGAS